jgi:hypothetical protein
MTPEVKGHIEIEDRGAVLIARVDGGPHGLFGVDLAEQLDSLVERVDDDPNAHAVVFTGRHPERFVSHADVRWLQEGGAAVPPVGVRGASALARTAKGANGPEIVGTVVRPEVESVTIRLVQSSCELAGVHARALEALVLRRLKRRNRG